MGLQVQRPVSDLRAGRIRAKVIIPPPVPGRPDGPGNEAAAAIGTHIVQYVIHAVGAKGAFVGTNTRLQGIRRQEFVTVLTGRTEFEHGSNQDANDRDNRPTASGQSPLVVGPQSSAA